jgi:hypothetical protein
VLRPLTLIDAAQRTLPVRATCKPAILLRVLQVKPELEWAVWLDDGMRRHPEESAVLTQHLFSLVVRFAPASGGDRD